MSQQLEQALWDIAYEDEQRPSKQMAVIARALLEILRKLAEMRGEATP